MNENKNIGTQVADLIKFKDILNICLSNWYLFVLSLALCWGGVTYIILKTQPLYSRTMTVLIKPNNVQKYSSSDLDQILSKNGMTAGNTKLVNEKISLSSIALMMISCMERICPMRFPFWTWVMETRLPL